MTKQKETPRQPIEAFLLVIVLWPVMFMAGFEVAGWVFEWTGSNLLALVAVFVTILVGTILPAGVLEYCMDPEDYV